MGENQILERVEAGWRELMDSVAGIPEARMDEPGVAGEWSVKDVLGHVAYWDAGGARIVERAIRGEPEPEQDPNWDFEPVNQQVQAERAGWSLRQVRDDLAASHARVVAAVALTPDLEPDKLSGNTWEHYDEHAQHIREWRSRVGLQPAVDSPTPRRYRGARMRWTGAQRVLERRV